MKKLIPIVMLLFIVTQSKSQNGNNIGLGVGSAVVSAALVTAYYVNSVNDIKSYTKVEDQKAVLRNVRRENAPYLFCAGGCALLSVVSFANIDLGHGLTLNVKPDRFTMVYAIK